MGSVPSAHCVCAVSCRAAELFPKEGEEKKCVWHDSDCRSCQEESWGESGSQSDLRLNCFLHRQFQVEGVWRGDEEISWLTAAGVVKPKRSAVCFCLRFLLFGN